MIRSYKCSLSGNKTNPIDLSLSVAIEMFVFATFLHDDLIMNYCKRIVDTLGGPDCM